MYSLFCAAYTGYQSTQGLTTRFEPCASTLSPTFLLSISLSFYPSTPLPNTSIHPRTHAPCIFLSSKLSHLVKEHSPSQAQLNGIYCVMDSDTLNLLLHLKQLSKPFSSDLRTNLPYLLDAVCVCVCMCVRMCACACVCMPARARVCVCGALIQLYWRLFLVLSMDFYVCTMWCESCRRHIFEYCCNCSVLCC